MLNSESGVVAMTFAERIAMSNGRCKMLFGMMLLYAEEWHFGVKRCFGRHTQ